MRDRLKALEQLTDVDSPAGGGEMDSLTLKIDEINEQVQSYEGKIDRSCTTKGSRFLGKLVTLYPLSKSQQLRGGRLPMSSTSMTSIPQTMNYCILSITSATLCSSRPKATISPQKWIY